MRSSSQRQSGENGTQQRHRLAHRAGKMRDRRIDADEKVEHRDDRGGVGEIGKLLAELNNAMLAQDRRLRSLTSFCTLMKSRPGTDRSVAKRSSGIERLRSFMCPLLPAQHIPTRRRPSVRHSAAPFRQPLFKRPHIRNVRRNGRELGLKCQRQAQAADSTDRSRGSVSPSLNTWATPGTVDHQGS